MKAKGVVHLMVPWEGGPPAERVFHKDEWPVLKRALKRGTVTKIIQVSFYLLLVYYLFGGYGFGLGRLRMNGLG